MSPFPVKTYYDNLNKLAKDFRKKLNSKKYILLYAYNGTGKTRLSCEFKSIGQKSNEETGEKTADTLYYNAYTEDLFYWDNDLENDNERILKMNTDSRFFDGLKELEMENRIRPLLNRYVDLDFTIDYEKSTVSFSKEIKAEQINEKITNIKTSRGEENIFIWCFFLAIIQLVKDNVEAYNWVKYIYIDDPISSLDDNNAIAIASHLSQILQDFENLKVVISTHHALFFNVMFNELNKVKGNNYFLLKDSNALRYSIQDTKDTPFFHHVALIKELKRAVSTGQLYTYHFNILRNILEKAASFHGYSNFGECIKLNNEDIDDSTYSRYINILSHGNYSLYEPKEMVEDNKRIFKEILERYMNLYRFNPDLFNETEEEDNG